MAILRRRLLEPPSWLQLDQASRRNLLSLPSRLEPLDADPLPAVLGAMPDRFQDLKHPLSDHFRALNPLKPERTRSPNESAIADDIALATIHSSVSCSSRFPKLLLELNERATGHTAGLRTTDIGLNPDKFGTPVIFPPARAIERQLERLRIELERNLRRRGPWCAVLSLAMVTNVHPFPDGNGRVARMLFNLCLRASLRPALPYVPLYELCERSEGAYEITLRDAEINGRWSGFCAFLTRAISVSVGLAQSDESRATTDAHWH